MVASNTIEPAILARRLLRRKWSVLLSGIAGATLALMAASGMPVRYAATGMLLTNPAAPGTSEASDRLTQTDVLQSPSLLLAVAQRLDLAKQPGLAARWRYPPVLAPLATAIERGAGALISVLGRSGEQEVTEADRLGMAVDDLRSQLAIASNETSRVLAITLKAGQAQLAANVVNELMQQYLAYDRSTRMASTGQAYAELDANANAAAREVEQADAAIDQFRQHHDVISLQAGVPAALQLNDQQARLAAANIDLAQAQATLDASQHAAGNVSSPALQTLHDRETDVLQRIALTTQFGPSNPKRIALEDELRSVRSQIEIERSKLLAAMARDVDVAQRKVASLSSMIDTAQTTAAGAGSAQYDMAQLVREADTKRAIYQDFRSRAETLRIASLQVSTPQIVSPAMPPRGPEPSRRSLLLVVGFAAGAILAATTVLLRAVLGQKLTSPYELAFATGMPALGSLPRVARHGRRGLVDFAMVGLGSLIPETLRGMRLTIQADRPEQPAKLVLITSSEAREGKTTVAVAIAQRAAADGLRVLIIDADLRRPSVAKVLGLPVTVSVEDALVGSDDFASKIQTDPVSTLHCLMARGDHPNPAMLLSSLQFNALMVYARQTYDIVFVDSPPVLRVSDPILLSRWADVIVFAVRANNTTQAMVAEALSRFSDQARSRVMTCLTRAPISRHDRAGYFAGYSRSL